MIEASIIIVWSILLVWWIPRWLRHSVLEVDTARGAWWPFWLYLQFLLVLPAPSLLALLGVSAFPTTLLVVRDYQTFGISLLVLYGVTFFFATVAICGKLIPRHWVETGGVESSINYSSVRRFATIAVAVAFGITIYGIVFLNYHNALLNTLATGKGLMTDRLANKYDTSLPSQVQFAISVAAWIAALHAGYSFALKRRSAAALFFLAGVILAGGDGGKSPIVIEFMLAGTSYLVAARKRLAVGVVLKGVVIGFPLLLGIIYFIVSLQMHGLSFSGFVGYLTDRIGMAQMAGTYDGIALGRLHGEFYWHMVPFANFFEHYIPYDKLLMMRVEGYDFGDVGVKNSFFISEAYGIGGYALVLASPFIVGMSWVLNAILMFLTMKWMFGRDVSRLYFLPLTIMYLNVTGGFSPFPLLKSFLLMVLILGLFWFPYFMISLLPKKRSGSLA